MGGLGLRCKQAVLRVLKKRFWSRTRFVKNDQNRTQLKEALGEITNISDDDTGKATSSDSKCQADRKRSNERKVEPSSKPIKSIIRQVYPSTRIPCQASRSIKKKVTIRLPSDPSLTPKIVSCHEELPHHKICQNISSQVERMKTEASKYLVAEHPDIKDSLEVLFDEKHKTILEELSCSGVEDLLFSLRTIIFHPLAKFKDLVINQVLDLLLHVTDLYLLPDLREKCLEVSGRLRSRHFYSDTDTCWADAQTVMVWVWCRVLEDL